MKRIAPSILQLLVALLPAAEPLVLNGGFETADPTDATRPLGWGRPDGLGISWREAPGGGKAMRFDTAVSEKDMVARWKAVGITEWDVPDASGGPIGATYGLSLYSDPIQIVKDQPYAIEVRHCGVGGGKIWVRGYVRNGDKLKRVYEAQTELKPSADWVQAVYAFHPTKPRPPIQPPTEVKVMLYAYWPAGESWFDDVRLRPASAEELATEEARRHGKRGTPAPTGPRGPSPADKPGAP
jgi:hypothetical protein